MTETKKTQRGIVKAYGDTLNDGKVQLSFTLPLDAGALADEAAKRYAKALGFDQVELTHSHPLCDGFTFFVAYGSSPVSVDTSRIHVVSHRGDSLGFDGVNAFIESKIGRKLVIVGACTGFDAHTVGIDAIMNMKGYNHHYGLERYPWIDAYNLGAQVPNEELMKKAIALKADAILVSQVVTQKDTHIENLTNFVELLEAEGVRDRFVIVAGGPRINHKLALELGYDAGFGRGTYADDVATFVAKKVAGR